MTGPCGAVVKNVDGHWISGNKIRHMSCKKETKEERSEEFSLTV
jgi:hypothetical protein